VANDRIQQKAAEPSHGWLGLFCDVAAAALVVLCIAWTLQLPSRFFGVALHLQQVLAAAMVPALVIALFRLPRHAGGRARPRFPELVAVIAGAACFAWLAIDYPRLLVQIPARPPEILVMSAIILVVTLEALRRSGGYGLFLIVVAFIAYGLVGHHVEGALATRRVPWDRLLAYLSLDLSALFGSTLAIGATVVVIYVLLGQVLLKSGGGAFFTDLAIAATRGSRGGAAKIAVIGSALFGSISGSAVSNVVSTGMVTIPMMRRANIAPSRAGAVEAVASTGGQLTPPIMGAAAFILAEYLSLPYASVVIAAIIPAALYYWAVFCVIDLGAGRDGIAPADAEAVSLGTALRQGWHLLVPFAVLFVALFWFRERAAVAAIQATSALVLSGALRSYGGHRLTPHTLWAAICETGMAVTPLLMILGGAGFLIGVLNVSGLGFALTLALLDLAGGNLFGLLAVAAIACVVLGMGMPTTGVYVLLATLIAPAIVKAGIEPLAAHFFVLYFGLMSMLTPPVAIAAFAAASISGARPMATGWQAMKLGWVAYVIPFMFVLSPTLLMIGSPIGIMRDAASAMLGVLLISVASVGWFGRPLQPALRGIAGLAGAATMIPDNILGLRGFGDAAGAVVGLAVLGWLTLSAPRRHKN
jgi:TRAP transporter 4TM/12TM fusion protein